MANPATAVADARAHRPAMDRRRHRVLLRRLAVELRAHPRIPPAVRLPRPPREQPGPRGTVEHWFQA